ncbi:MAG: PEP-CTERM sorting domain-containing protein [Deltaproteobacteria bacterium]|nr:PEP-CTERM sorting domain-containing protein [Deltaproteobacteria bacterium]
MICASSFVSWTRCFVFRVGLLSPLASVLLFGLAVGAGSLLAPETALADTALFRVEQSWHNFPNPAVTTPGGAGMYQAYIQPYVTKTMMGTEYLYPPATAIVEPGNPIGGKFTLPQSFITYSQTPYSCSECGRFTPGYTTITHSVYYNGPGVFGPNHGATGPTRVVFPTTGGNSYPNYGLGAPVTPTTTFNGLYDLSRGGSITVTPGPRRFGGTFRIFYRPEAYWYQYIYYFTPALYKAYGDFSCLDEGMFDCTPGTFKSSIGDTTAGYQATWYLLNVKGTGTGDGLQTATAKATTPTTSYGTDRTPYGNASFITGMRRYLNRIHPWTTGFAKVHNAKGSPKVITPQAQGYDISLGGADITVTHVDWNLNWNQDLSTLTTTTRTWKQYLYGVGRVVSMVRPRLIHTYTVPVDMVGRIENTWNVARMWRLKVFFVPEPTGMLLLGTGVAALLGLSRMRRR